MATDDDELATRGESGDAHEGDACARHSLTAPTATSSSALSRSAEGRRCPQGRKADRQPAETGYKVLQQAEDEHLSLAETFLLMCLLRWSHWDVVLALGRRVRVPPFCREVVPAAADAPGMDGLAMRAGQPRA